MKSSGDDSVAVLSGSVAVVPNALRQAEGEHSLDSTAHDGVQ